MSHFAGLGAFGDGDGTNIIHEDETSIKETLKQLQFLWENKF